MVQTIQEILEENAVLRLKLAHVTEERDSALAALKRLEENIQAAKEALADEEEDEF